MLKLNHRFLKSASLVVGAGVLAVVLAMSSDVQAKENPRGRDSGNPFAQLSDEHTGLSGDHTGLSGDHTGLSGDHTGLSGDHTGLSSDHTGLSTDHSDLSEKLDQVLEAINNLPAGGGLPCGAGTEGQRFVVSPDETEVCDNTTGLVWEQMPDSNLRALEEADDHCQELGMGNVSRLPKVKELITLVDYSVAFPGPVLPTDLFGNVKAAAYWTATSLAGFPTFAWDVDFSSGRVSSDFNGSNHFVWCVGEAPDAGS